MDKPNDGARLTSEMMEAMLDEIAQYSIDLEEDPTQVHLGIPYLQRVLAKCRQYTNRVQYYMQRTKRYENRLRSEIKILELDLDFKMKEKLADDALVRKQPSIEDRKALATTMLADEHRSLANLQVELQDVEETYKIIKAKHMELQRTSNDIKTQRNLVKDDMLARLGGHEGYVKPQVAQDKSVPEGLPPPVEVRPDPKDLLGGVQPGRDRQFDPPPLDSSLQGLMDDFLNNKQQTPARDAADALVESIENGTFGAGLDQTVGEVLQRAQREKAEREHVPQPNGLLCAECREPQFTTPGGPSCKNGHGGADGVDPQAVKGPEPKAEEKDPNFNAPVATGMSYEDLLS